MMAKIVTVAMSLLTAFALPGQDREDSAAKFGDIFKRQVDGLIASLAKMAGPDGALGDGSCRQTAQVLTAMGNCHRFYSLGDGPVMRKAIHQMFLHRQRDGSFADQGEDGEITTAWVLHALSSLAPEIHAQEIMLARRWLEQRAAQGSDPWEQLLDRTTYAVTDQGSPLAVGAAAAEALSTVDRLCALVACQVVARRMDRAQEPDPGSWTDVQQLGVGFLLDQQQQGVFHVVTPDGTFPDTGLTGMGLAALQTEPPMQRGADQRLAIRQGLAYLIAEQNQDGSFGRENVNYTTCAAVLALSMAGDKQYEPVLQQAQKYILSIQNIEDRDYERSDRDYGSIGYGGDQRGDLSNLQFAIEALRKTGLRENHEALAKALVFLQRTQNLVDVNDFETRTRDGSDGSWHKVRPGNDGGAAYYPGNSPAGYIELGDGSKIPRSYGSMTYALLKTYTLCGLSADDPRVQAAVHWIESHWTLDENPGSSPRLGEQAKYQGLYYYYMVLAQALDVVGKDQLLLAGEADEPVDWRDELSQHLGKLQRTDGSWLNQQNGRWWESQPVICTIYAMLALDRCQR